jgi:hypothetical protein
VPLGRSRETRWDGNWMEHRNFDWC